MAEVQVPTERARMVLYALRQAGVVCGLGEEIDDWQIVEIEEQHRDLVREISAKITRQRNAATQRERLRASA